MPAYLHIIIHKSKEPEYENALVIENKETKEFLLSRGLLNNEEHRILYVAISRTKRKLFFR
jgi:ATP-dependent DNA helicase UvrD/PcrA